MPPKFSRSLDSCNRSYCRRSLSNLRGDSSPALAHEARGGPDVETINNNYFSMDTFSEQRQEKDI